MTEKRKNFVWGWTSKSRLNSSKFLFKCKNCDHEYLKEISPFTIKDISFKSSEHHKKFWAQRFTCPKCKNYTPPVILLFEPNNTKWSELKPITINNEKWKDALSDNKKIKLDDYEDIY